MTEINFVGGEYKGRSSNVDAQVCQNFYPVIDNEGGRILTLIGGPGLKEWCDLGYAYEIRGMKEMNGTLYVVCGSKVFSVNQRGTATELTGTLATETGLVFMECNLTEMFIVDGTNSKIITDGLTVEDPTGIDYAAAGSLTYQDGYFIVADADTQKFWISGLYDGNDWDALDFASAEALPDNIVRAFNNNRELWLFGEKTTEPWYNSGNSLFPFERIPGAVMELGLGAKMSVAKEGGILFWLDHNFNVRAVSQGYSATKISTSQIDYRISQCSEPSSARAWAYTQEGQLFYVLTFPSDDLTVVYDVITGIWHTRATGTDDGRYRANCYAYYAGKCLVGDYASGKILELDLDTYDHDGMVMRSIRTAQAISNNRKRIFHGTLEIEFEAGVGLATGDGSDPQAVLEYSDDDAHTWSNEIWTDMGETGEYGVMARWHKLGSARSRIYRLTITDPVKRVVLGANIIGSIGKE
jgi:hypothetical protein